MKTLNDLAQAKGGVWRYFALICSTPHPSGHEEKLAALLKAEAEKSGLSVKQDSFGNLRIDRKAAPGYENAPCIILQAHLDMVPQKAAGSNFDFLKDALKVVVSGNKLHCSGETTLGADDGSGVALAMDMLTDTSFECGPLAAVFTREEEIGLNGARALAGEFLEGTYLLNLDSGCDSCFYAGCAGGEEEYGYFTPEFTEVPARAAAVKIEVAGLAGGHSGADIHLQRGNAHKFMAALLTELNSKVAVASISGGSVVNAISRESTAICVSETDIAELQKCADAFAQKLKTTFDASAEFGFKLTLCPMPAEVWTKDFQSTFLEMLNRLPDGVFEFSEELDCVCTSCNLGLIGTTDDGRIKVGCHPRAFDDAKWQENGENNKKLFEKFGGTFEAKAPYPGWKFKADSKLLEAGQKACEAVYGKRIPVRAIHAGLESGIFTASAPDLEMIAFSPADHHCHTTEEYLEIDSTENVAQWLREVVKILHGK